MAEKDKKSVGSFKDLGKLKPDLAARPRSQQTSVESERPKLSGSSVEARDLSIQQTKAFYKGQLQLLGAQRQKFADEVNAFKRERRKWQKTAEVYPARIEELRKLRRSITERIADLRSAIDEWSGIVERAAQMSGMDDPLDQLTQCVRKIESQSAQLETAIRENKKESTRLKRSETSIKSREARMDVLEKKMKRQSDRSRALRAELRESKAEVEGLGRQLRSSKRKASKLSREHDGLLERTEVMRAWMSGFDWVIENGGPDDQPLGSDVVLVGSGPFGSYDMQVFLESKGINVWETNSEDVGVMIVGSDDWTEEELEMQIAAQQGGELRVYSQEMAMLSLTAGTDILEAAPDSVLMEFAEGHGALEFLIDGELRWPLTSVSEIPRDFRPFDGVDSVEQSPLKALGYTVGKTKGLPATSRREILEKAYLRELPFVHSDDYMRDWGHPRTRRRLGA